jgi:hypothetical protein
VPAVKHPVSRELVLWFAAPLAALVLGACGGSASETPWPTEPDDVDLGPIGESQREEDPVQKSKDKSTDDSAAGKEKAEPAPSGKKVDPVAP